MEWWQCMDFGWMRFGMTVLAIASFMFGFMFGVDVGAWLSKERDKQ